MRKLSLKCNKRSRLAAAAVRYATVRVGKRKRNGEKKGVFQVTGAKSRHGGVLE